jgi:hypothetical protein
MEKKSIIIIVLSILLVILIIIFIFGYFKWQKLMIRNNQLEQDRAQISKDKENVIVQFEQCRTDAQNLNSKLKMLEEDVAKIYKGCITQNACKGKYSNIRWNCNNVGDEININPSHICYCDTSCNLITTEIEK